MSRIKLKNLMYFTHITLSILILSSSSTLSASNQTAGSCQIFKNSQHEELYWQALIHAAHNRTDQAKAITKALNENNQEAIAAFKNTPKSRRSIDDLFDELFVFYMKEHPQYLTLMGLPESINIKNHNRIFDDCSPAGLRHQLEIAKEIVNRLEQWPTEQLTLQQQISHDVLHWNFTVEEGIEKEKFLFHKYYVNQMYGMHYSINKTLTSNQPLKVNEDVECYLSRLSCIPKALTQIIELLKHQYNLGITPPRFVYERVINSLRASLPEKVAEHMYYQRLAQNVDNIDPHQKEAWLEKTKDLLMNKVYPAYKNLISYLADTQKNVTTNHGVWALPNGDEYYQHKLKEMTTTNLTAEQIHTMGLQEVARIQQEMRSVLDQEGYSDPDKSLRELFQAFSADPKYYFPETEQGKTDCLDAFRDILKRSRKKLYPLFNLKPQDEVEIKRIPKHQEDGASAGRYAFPSFDGFRPGIFYINLRSMKEVPRFRMETLGIHEAEPGHHFQYSIQVKLDVAILRRMCSYAACGEGWALYAERLAYEQGFYSSRASILGHLHDELQRAIRLVVDTGIHKYRWSREFAIDYMLNNTGYTRPEIVTEIERYFVMPGQACGYKIGQLKILELRKKAQDELGDKFNIVDFHDAILSVGCIPLKVLEGVIETYIQKKKTP